MLVEALACFLAEVAFVEPFDQAARRSRIFPCQTFSGRHRDVEADHIHEFDRPHRHAEGQHGFVDRLRRDAFINRAHGFEHVRTEHRIDEEAGRALHG